MTSEKLKLIQTMIEMQKKFSTLEHQHELNAEDYFAPDKDHPMAGYRQEYDEIAAQVIDMAHAEKSSKR